jgi:hypothetical protein
MTGAALRRCHRHIGASIEPADNRKPMPVLQHLLERDVAEETVFAPAHCDGGEIEYGTRLTKHGLRPNCTGRSATNTRSSPDGCRTTHAAPTLGSLFPRCPEQRTSPIRGARSRQFEARGPKSANNGSRRPLLKRAIHSELTLRRCSNLNGSGL